MNEKNRQESLNHAYDALMDLATVLNIPPKAISLNGTLGIAFGARGKGSAAAHYEGDKVVINLTKLSGAGSLAHEWGHALDDYFGKLAQAPPYGKYSISPISAGKVGKESELRPEILEAWLNVRDAIRQRAETKEEAIARTEKEIEKSVRYTKSWLDSIRRELEQDGREYNKMRRPATKAELKRWDRIASEILEGKHKPVLDDNVKSKYSFKYTIPKVNTFFKNIKGVLPPADTRSSLAANVNGLIRKMEHLKEIKADKVKPRMIETQFKGKAGELGKVEYWGNPHELFARAFESYVDDVISEQPEKSQYLVHSTQNKIYKDVSPYPMGAERIEINKAFDNLFEVMESKETEEGVALYSIGEAIPITGDDALIDLVKKVSIFKKAKVGMLPDGSVWVRNKHGQGINIKSVKQIDADNIAIQMGHGKMLEDGEFVLGKYEDGEILIQKDAADEWVILHEGIHAFEDLGFITKTDVSILSNHIKNLSRKGRWDSEKREVGGAEDRAVWLSQHIRDRTQKGPVRQILQKIADFVDTLVNIFHRTARGVVRGVESGRIFEGETAGIVDREKIPSYAISKVDDIGQKIVDDIAFKSKKFDISKEDVNDFLAKMYHLFVMKEYPIVRLAKKAGDKDIEDTISKQIRRRRGESGVSETILASKNVEQVMKELEKDGITEYRHIKTSLADILKDITSDSMYRDYERMRVAERDLALAKYRPDIKGVNAKKARMILDLLKKKYGETADGRVETLSQISDRHREFERDAILKPLVESGWLSQEQYDNITGRPESEYYASFLRVMERAEGERVGRGKDPIKRIYGSERKKIPSVEGTIANLRRTVSIVEEQRLTKQLVKLREISEEFEDVIKEISPIYRTVKGKYGVYKKEDTKRALRAFETKEEADIYAAGVKDAIVIKRPDQSIRIPFRPQGTIVVAENGVKKYYSVPTDISKALDTYTPQEITAVMKILGAPARLLRAGATLSAEFIMRNPVRDQFSAFVYSKYGYNPFTDFGRGVFSLIAGRKEGQRLLRGLGFSKASVERANQLYDEFRASGGEMAYFVSLDRQKVHMTAQNLAGYKKGFKFSTLNPIEALRILSEVMEKGTRLGLYSKAKAKGATALEAMTEARGSTLDFGRIGQIRALNQIIAFWNANVQGTSKLRQEMLTHPKKAAPQLIKAVLGITLPSIILWGINHNDERYQRLPEWQKNFFWIIPIGKDGPIIRVPKPFELGLIFGSLPERILDYLYNNDVAEVKSIAKAIKDGAMPGLIPTAALPLIEHMTNYSFFRERRLESLSIQNRPVEMRYTPYTSEVAKEVGQLVKVSPIKLENWVRDWSGSLGYTAIKGLDPLLEKEDVPEVGKKWYQVTPGIRGFIARDPYGSSSKTTNQFYDHYEEATQKATGYKLLIQKDIKEAKLYLKKNYVAIRSVKKARKVAGRISDLRKRQHKIMESGMASEKKRSEIDLIDREISKLTEKFNRWYRKMEKGKY